MKGWPQSNFAFSMNRSQTSNKKNSHGISFPSTVYVIPRTKQAALTPPPAGPKHGQHLTPAKRNSYPRQRPTTSGPEIQDHVFPP